ncbi:outer membrane lipoprotein carrier protein LolA [Shewanella intestini]|uniref:Outer membrane lipoprotein carrier protein LolA n=1 Tax=Shewanella intestini TaxID=2017544 RepID=A0ABS5I2S1_9GAMM|nr:MULTISPECIES: outer membrane lipoprotein carrier protein LolA [Shewanella]MBR9728321.1 outer membrane lipoprotein carrier protein LolA [Shewanella intestini]MRG35786.1 hypothetical protein [Shewanella sp. XMDDZSB0408]
MSKSMLKATLISLMAILNIALVQLSWANSVPAAPVQKPTFDINVLAQLFAHTTRGHGSYQQQKKMSVLTLPLASQGVYYVEPGNTIVWQQQQPFAQTTLIKDGALSQFINGELQPNTKAAGGQAASQMIMALFSGQWQSLSQDFSVNLTGNAAQWQIKLTPKSGPMAKVFSAINLQGQQQVINHISLTEHSGDNTQITLLPANDSPIPTSISRVLNHG